MISHFFNLKVLENILTRKEREFLLRKHEIIDASVKLFASKGFNHTTLDEIAALSEFGKGIIISAVKKKFILQLWKTLVKILNK